jgi:hypothetical protein
MILAILFAMFGVSGVVSVIGIADIVRVAWCCYWQRRNKGDSKWKSQSQTS